MKHNKISHQICCSLFELLFNVPKLWYERSLRQGSIISAAVGKISKADFSGLDFVEYCLTKRALDASNPGKLDMWAINELLLARSESAIIFDCM